MTNYSLQASKVRISRFKPSGKWYDDFEVDMNDFYNEPLIHPAVLKAWEASRDPGSRSLEEGWMLVCLEPYHHNAHPVMIIGGRNYG
jgi:hypothetical protein